RNAFLYGLGAKYVQALKKRGGWSLVNQRYAFTPTSTATILHPDERIVPINLGPGRPVGELGLISLLRGQPASTPLAVAAAAGWRGDRTVEEAGGKGWVVVFARPEQAARFQAALVALRNAEYPKVERLPDPSGQRWKSSKGLRGVLLRGDRVVE